MMNLEDDGHCFVCGPMNPAGLKLDFHFNGKTIKTEFTPEKKHQGYVNIVHGGIITTILDEAMVKLAIALDMPAVTAHMNVRLRKPLTIGETVMIEARIERVTKKLLDASAEAVKAGNVIVADAKGKLVRVS
jgi:uncharacterized protein (TIGR00369 family)